MTCPDTTVLVDVEIASEWRGSALVAHLATCDACRAAMADLEAVRSATTVEDAVDESEVEALVEAMAATGRTRGRSNRWREAGVTFALAFATAVGLQLALMDGVGPSSWLGLVVAAAAAALAASAVMPRALAGASV